MKRRTFLATTAAFLAASPVLAGTGLTFKPGLVKRELAAGKTVFIDFYTNWCTTCRSQKRTIDALKSANPAYEENVVFIGVDWDQYANSNLARGLNIPRRSTLVVLKGDQELGRIVAGTRKSAIEALMDTALAAAVA